MKHLYRTVGRVAGISVQMLHPYTPGQTNVRSQPAHEIFGWVVTDPVGMKHLYRNVGQVVGVLVQMLHPYPSMALQPAIAFHVWNRWTMR